MKLLNNKFPGIYYEKRKRMRLYTKNLTPGEKVYGERLKRKKDEEYREWDPRRSKLAAAILKRISQVGLNVNDSVLYLGASTGTTVSHISDIVGDKGFIFALDFAPRVMRDLVFLSEKRKNIAPVLADATQPRKFLHLVSEVDFLYQDVAQKNQAEIFIKNASTFLKPGGFAFLCVKSRSEDVTKSPKKVYSKVRDKLEKEMIVADFRILDPYEKDHCVFICKKK
ncbi:fibrillarin-like rRNA/tRNA 2'-O-methyltransferase [Candidatus Woesearchaeota archaeon]|nr:fibrillarin-like rRNA/tRNA 2'-O-methyltransferase [Candidatus Woesearchaeota archaeon]